MILIDLSQIIISNVMADAKNSPDCVDIDHIRHMVLNSIRKYNVKFKNEFGDVVICCDDRVNWRKDEFPYYKCGRKESRDASGVDWKELFACLETVKAELKENLPYYVLQVHKAEADDIIATMVARFHTTEIFGNHKKTVIVSGDKDFAQLQIYQGVTQFDPIQKRQIIENRPERFLKEHIMRGDKGDSIPNFLSVDDSFINKIRQKSLTTKNFDVWIDQEPEEFCSEIQLKHWKRNEVLIDLSKIPEEIQTAINTAYDAYVLPPRRGLRNYFMKHRMSNLMDSLSEF